MKTAKELMAFIFGTGTMSRSAPYLQAFEAVLTANRDLSLCDPECPFESGTLEHDAWCCGQLDAENFDDLQEGVVFGKPDDDAPFELLSAG